MKAALLFLGLSSCALESSVEDACVNMPLGASRDDVRDWLGPERHTSADGDQNVAVFGDYPDGCVCVAAFTDDTLTSAHTDNCN